MKDSASPTTKYAESDGIHCISDDCVYFASGCGIKRVLLVKGICRYFKAKTTVNSLDRTDLPEEIMAAIR
jgi:hypothetical protein